MLSLDGRTVALLELEAHRRGISLIRLTRELLAHCANDGLFAAVIDG